MDPLTIGGIILAAALTLTISAYIALRATAHWIDARIEHMVHEAETVELFTDLDTEYRHLITETRHDD